MRFAAMLSIPILLATGAARAEEPANLALTHAAASLGPNRFVWRDTAQAGPVSVLVSIPDQRAYVFRGEVLIGAATISTGTDDKPTPTGSFTILQKAAAHRSNLYDDAPMPYMQRLTWDGVALHAGRNPGFPASHGCIRLPTAFAKRLFAVTELGATVEVTDAAYVSGAHPGEGFDEPGWRTADEMAEANRIAARAVTQREVDRALAAR